MIKEIVTDEEQLSIRCDEVDIRKELTEVRQIIIDLKETLRATETGVGLSANQIGYNKRVFIINFNGEYRSFINPIIANVKGLTINRESCLSLPGREFIRPRHNDIDVIYQTPLGKTVKQRMFGMAAYVFQHEIDHLDGLLLSDIGLEIDGDFDKATDAEREELINSYLDSLDLKQKDLDQEIKEDAELTELDKGIKFMTALQKGEVKLEPLKKENSDN